MSAKAKEIIDDSIHGIIVERGGESISMTSVYHILMANIS